MGLMVTTLLCAYTLAKVVRDALFLANFGALDLPYAYVGVAIASVAFVWIESLVTRRFTRLNTTRFNQYLAIAFGVAAALLYPYARSWTTAGFYLWTGSQAMILIPHFWVLALDVWDSQRARRLFPLLSGCGLIGGLIGGGIAAWLTPAVKRVGLMWIVAALFIATHALTRLIERHRARRPTPIEIASTLSRWAILRRSVYLRLLAVALALSVIIGTLIDFQFKFFIQRVYPDPHALTQFLGAFQVVLNGLALILQFGAVGWLFHRLGLAGSTGLQPVSIMLLGWWVAATSGWWAVVAMRWVQGVVLQTVGKSAAEIYYMAVRPPERRRIKPVIDTLVERWSDALVGLLLIVLLRAVGVSISILIGITVAMAAVWLVVLFFLNRQYGRAFEEALSHRWLEPESAPESLRTPAAQQALLQAIESDDPKRVILALNLAAHVRTPAIIRAVVERLEHPAPEVRAAAIHALEELRYPLPEGAAERFIADPHEGVSGAAIRYLLTMRQEPASLLHRLLDGDDSTLRRHAVDALLDRPHAAPGVLTLEWVDARLAAGTEEDLILAARALGAIPGSSARARLHGLLTGPSVEVQRAALLSAARRPSGALIDIILSLLFVPELSYEARVALAAAGDAAVPGLTRFLRGEQSPRAQALAARALAEVGSPRAIGALMALLRSADPAQRLLALRNLSLIRVQSGRPVISRGAVHKLFLREMRAYRTWLEPAYRLETSADPDIRLLAESYREYAELALERALRALACWYDPKPLAGAFDRLKSRDFDVAATALEYMGHILPHSVFRPIGELFQTKLTREHDKGTAAPERLEEWIRSAWQSGDAWLRACAVRASRRLPGVNRSWFEGVPASPIVEAELAARFSGDGSGAATLAQPRPARRLAC